MKNELMKVVNVFKTKCMREIAAAFPKQVGSPLYAGFGNRPHDGLAYSDAGIPMDKVFIIGKDGVVHVGNETTSYSGLAHAVDKAFPRYQ